MIYAGCATSWLLRRALPSQRQYLKHLDEIKRGLYLRKFALIPTACAVLLLGAALAQGQETDIALGAGTLFSTHNTSATQVYTPPGLKAGLYPSFSLDHFYKNHFGFEAEVTGLAKRGLYNGFQGYRPILYDFNGLYVHRFGKKLVGDAMAGAGGERLLFYRQEGGCVSPTGCQFLYNSNHFLVHVGADARYTVWRHFFIRPEAHFYHIFNNREFHSDNVLRLGASVGYTFTNR
jgi:hypothetical protein